MDTTKDIKVDTINKKKSILATILVFFFFMIMTTIYVYICKRNRFMYIQFLLSTNYFDAHR